MVTKLIGVLIVMAGLLMSSPVCFAQPASKTRGPKPRPIKIYFYHDPGEYIDLSPVTRMIRSSAPARAAIIALLAGPTPAEERRGFGGLISAGHFRIGKLTITRGTARINFVSSRTWAGWPGDLAPVKFKKAVELTLKQFSSVQHVIVSLDGDPNFESEG